MVMAPRQIDIDKVSDEEIQDIILTANLTPRKCLDFFQAILVQICATALRPTSWNSASTCGALGAPYHHALGMAAVGPASGEQAPAFSSEKQAQRILNLLIGHANVLAFTLTHGPQHYEPGFYAHKIDGSSVAIVDEWCCGYVKGIALDPVGLRPLIDARPDWFEVGSLTATARLYMKSRQFLTCRPNLLICVNLHPRFVRKIILRPGCGVLPIECYFANTCWVRPDEHRRDCARPRKIPNRLRTHRAD